MRQLETHLWEAVYSDGRSCREFDHITVRQVGDNTEYWGELARPKYSELDRKLLIGFKVYFVWDLDNPVVSIRKETDSDILFCRRFTLNRLDGTTKRLGFKVGIFGKKGVLVTMTGEIKHIEPIDHLFGFEVA